MSKQRARRGTGSLYRSKRSRYWHIQYYVGGRRVRESTGTTSKTEAQRTLTDRVAKAQNGSMPVDVRKVTFDQLADLVRADYRKNNRKSADRLELSLDHLSKHFGGWRAVHIKEPAIDGYIAARLDQGAANGTVNRELAALRRAFRLGKKLGLVAVEPEIEVLEEDNIRTGFVEHAMFARLEEELPEHLRALALTGFVTGWRKRMLLSRRWRNVDLESGWLRMEPGETKNKKGINFPLGKVRRLKAALEAQRDRKLEIERRTGHIIEHLFFYYEGQRAGEPILDFRGAWEAACRRAGCPGLLFHDLRRTAVRNLVRSGVAESVAMKFTGHLTASVFKRYAIEDEKMLEEGGAKLDGFLEDTMPAMPDRKVLSLG